MERQRKPGLATQIGELGCFEMPAWHPLALERLDDALGRGHLLVLPAEDHLAGDETPGSAGPYVHLIHHRAAAPPLRDQLGVGERCEHAHPGSVEHALDVNFAVARCRQCDLLCHRCGSPFVRSSSSPNRSRRSSTMRRSVPIHASTSSSRRGPSVQRRVRPTFCVATSSAASSTRTCFFIPVSEMPNGSASSVIVALPVPSRSSTARRVGSAIAVRVRSIGAY